MLTIENCISWLWTSVRAQQLSNIVNLSLGFSYDMGSLGDGFGRSMWNVIGYCTSLRYLYLFRSNERGPPICYPEMQTQLQTLNIHRLSSLHIDDSDVHISNLIRWIHVGAAAHSTPGSLKCFKLQCIGGLAPYSASDLTKILATHHPSLEILVLQGVRRLRPIFLKEICDSFPLLRGLSIYQRKGCREEYNESGRCSWDYPVSAYAKALAGTNIRHFESNFPWTSSSFSPRALDRLLAAEAIAGDETTPSPPRLIPARYHKRIVEDDDVYPEEDDDRMADDVAAFVIPFASVCAHLQSFAIRYAGTPVLSCRIARHTGLRVVECIRINTDDEELEVWNPPRNATWSNIPIPELFLQP
ncbi:hypothetical protein EXIGLDRAFT_758821 [Exidia glandulosa HHB12029]|uniref:Uncharacterized protein n=1 Tax=Exidia glandulosa HHB12029 TaxID=1314781 RepID=A0A165QE06_EXIGL|nr:hypothetical protein EXIGLDRAFT_758821 [Exidia glandulosa HHB12029]